MLASALGQIGIENLEKIFEDTLRRAMSEELAPTRTNVTLELSDYTLNANTFYNIDKSDLTPYSAILVTLRVTYNSSATSGVRIRRLYSQDGTSYDSIEDAEDVGNYEDLTFAAGKTRQRTGIIPLFTQYPRIQIVNLDLDYAVTINSCYTLLFR